MLRFDPFTDFDALVREALAGPIGSGRSPRFMPMDLCKIDDHYVLTADLPGVDPGSVDVSVENGTLTVSVDVTNAGPVAGTEVVQLYVGYNNTALKTGWGRPVKDLRAFARAEDLAPGATKTVTLTVKASDLGYWDAESDRWVVEKMDHQLYVGPSSDSAHPNMLKGTFTIQ